MKKPRSIGVPLSALIVTGPGFSLLRDYRQSIVVKKRRSRIVDRLCWLYALRKSGTMRKITSSALKAEASLL